ncbi:MAG TPA: hypothetical protein VLG36_05655 [Candidatus Chromulinivoraceae bacterium]|nr:hypothetical protein [Candidatus Chromulinivoraceae bacterium]
MPLRDAHVYHDRLAAEVRGREGDFLRVERVTPVDLREDPVVAEDMDVRESVGLGGTDGRLCVREGGHECVEAQEHDEVRRDLADDGHASDVVGAARAGHTAPSWVGGCGPAV